MLTDNDTADHIAHNNGAVYGVLDIVANEFIGNLIIKRNDAAAIRVFSETAAHKEGGPIASRPQDYNLVRLGYVTRANLLVANSIVVMKGEDWLAAQQRAENKPTLMTEEPKHATR